MAADVSPTVDFWSELEEATATVETWPEWQQQYDADIYGDVTQRPRGTILVSCAPSRSSDPPDS